MESVPVYDEIEKINQLRNELKKERQKLQTEKLEYNRWLRENARDELFVEKIIDAIERNVDKAPSPAIIPISHNDRYAVLVIADMHYGADFTLYGINNEIINSYNPDIFEQRMNLLLSETIDYLKKENINHIKVFNLGDSLDGFLRNSQIWSLRYGVVESAIRFGTYMGNWLNQLSHHVSTEYYQTNGNHGELRLLDGIKGGHVNDNIEFVTGALIKLINKDNLNFDYIENKSGYIFTEVAGYKLLGIHGEVKDADAALKEYRDIYNEDINYLLCGHKHHSDFKNTGIRRGYIGVGSIIGSDEYSYKLRKSADATASCVIFEEGKGKTDEHTFVLN